MAVTSNKIYLMPGKLVISDKDEIIWTLLGSCLSIVFYNKRKRISGVCHAQLPYEGSKESCKATCPKPCGLDSNGEFMYVTCSFKHLINCFHDLGISDREIEVGLYGGANIFDFRDTFSGIGAKNIDTAKELFHENNLKIKFEDVGGRDSRTITHHSDTGITDLKKTENRIYKKLE